MFNVSVFAQFRTHSTPSIPAAVLIYPVQRVQRSGVCAVRGLLWAVCLVSGTACAAACAVQSFRACWREQGCTGGVYSRRPAPLGECRDKIFQRKRRFSGFVSQPTHPLFSAKNTPTPIANLQNFPQKQKRPLQRVCVLCYTCLTSLEREESVK